MYTFWRAIIILGLTLNLSSNIVASSTMNNSTQTSVPHDPAPIVFSPSQDWDGNDGPWSSFALQIGTPPQDVKVLIGTAATQTWVVLPEGCTLSDPSNCAQLRGGEFLLNESTTWTENFIDPSNNIYVLGLESALGYTGNGEYGFETIGLGWQGSGGPVLPSQTVAGIATKDFYLGIFGLTPRPSNFTDSFNHPIPSYLENLRSQLLIPSTTWAYTAGSQYQLGQPLGSLTIGGYDATKFIPNNVSWSFNERDARDLSVNLSLITTTFSDLEVSLLDTPISIFLDSTVPYIWLPLEACLRFEQIFKLTWNNDTQLYLLDEAQHNSLLAQNSSVTFALSNYGSLIHITFPYAAFDLVIDYPIVQTPTRYFPLKRASNESQYTLGRTFFQEAYIIADYDRRNFSVSQCNWTTNAQQEIVTIFPPLNSTISHSAHSLPPLTIAGVAIAAILALVFVISFIIYFQILKPRQLKHRADLKFDPILKAELDVVTPRNETSYGEVDGQPMFEIASTKGSVPTAEADGRALDRHEMQANEDVAHEMIVLNRIHELEGSNLKSLSVRGGSWYIWRDR